VGVFTLLVACGLGLPLPEDIALITGGFLAAMGPPHGVGSVWFMMVVGLLGIVVGDSIIFKAGHDYGDALLHTRLGKHIPEKRVEKVRALFVRHGSKMIMVARFLPGIRAVTYFVAGTSGVRYWVFLTYDGLAALISAPLWVWLGYWMGRRHAIRRAYAMAKEFQLVLIGVAAVAALSTVLYYLVTNRRTAAAELAKSNPSLTPVPPNGAAKNGKNGVQHPSTPAPPAPGAERV
jgi:membrane protein DedA with SNARE-associated domain